MKLFVVRHGETDYNVARKMQGYQEIPLNDRGIAQAAQLADRLALSNVDAIVSSDLRRTVMTASILAAKTGAPIRYDDRLRERDPGALVECSYDQEPGFFTDPLYQPPGGERMDVFSGRVRGAFESVVETYAEKSENLVVVTHGFVCRAFVAEFFGESASKNVGSGNATLTIVHYVQGEWSLETATCGAHLSDSAALGVLGNITGS